MDHSFRIGWFYVQFVDKLGIFIEISMANFYNVGPPSYKLVYKPH